MASIKISELNEYTQVEDDDLFVVVDTTNNETKKIKAANVDVGVVNSLDGSETNKAPSVAAVNTAFAKVESANTFTQRQTMKEKIFVVEEKTGRRLELAGGYLELYHSTPYVDFHYDNDTSDYTSRIIESSKGKLSINGKVLDESGTRGVKTLTSSSHSGFGTNNSYVPDISFISFWNGAYSNTNTSNLKYCVNGEILSTTSSSSYTKMSDGTLICYGSVSCPSMATNAGTTQTVTLPVSFANVNYIVSMNCTGATQYFSYLAASATNKKVNSFTVQYWNNASGTSGATKFDYVAIGRWK